MNNYLQRRNNTVSSIFDAFEDFFRPVFASENDYLKSNVRETDAEYQIDVAVPGFKKEQIKISLENGYLSIVCSKNEQEESDEKDTASYRRKEISEYSSRTFHVGEDITQNDIKAKYENGILCLTIPKIQPKIPEKSYIAIE
ncbi:MAG: Hsp20 family protein [Clostridia bacterium]|nr:Hsp20 family protein [Clostridia bacterium]